MFGCLSLDGPHREGCLLAGLRTHLPLSRTTWTQQFFGSAPQNFGDPAQRHRSMRDIPLDHDRGFDRVAYGRRSAGGKIGRELVRYRSRKFFGIGKSNCVARLELFPSEMKKLRLCYADDPEFSTIGASSHGGLPTTSVYSRT